MSIEFDILADKRWHIHERKLIDIRVTDSEGNPIDLTPTSLIWRVTRWPGREPLFLTRSTTEATITPVAHDDDEVGTKSIARCAVEASDYMDFPGSGVWHHELRDSSDDLVLSTGKAVLLPALPAEEES